MFLNKTWYLSFILILNIQISDAQPNRLNYLENLTITDGLAHNGVTDIIEDSRGYIWVASYEGLNRYNGFDFETFKNSVGKQIFLSNRIRSIAEDKNGNIWFGSDHGVSVYNYLTSHFTDIYTNSSSTNSKGPIVLDIAFAGHLALCSTEDEGLITYNTLDSVQTKYIPKIFGNDELISLFDCVVLDDSNYVFSSSKGLLHFHLTTGIFRVLECGSLKPYSTSLSLYPNKTYIYSAHVNGLGITKFIKNKDTYEFRFVAHQFDRTNFRELCIDPTGNLWLGTYNEGVIRSENAIQLINPVSPDTSSFLVNKGLFRLSCFYATQTDCWVGTFNKGIYRFRLTDNPFKSYNISMNMEYGITSNHILQISEWNDNSALIASNNGGLGLFNTKSHKFEPLPFNLPPNYTSIVFPDSRGNTWLKFSTNLGVSYIPKNQRVPIPVDPNDKHQLRKTLIFTIAEDNYGNIWLGGSRRLVRINISANGSIGEIEDISTHPYFANKRNPIFRSVYADPIKPYIWVGTHEDGLIRLTQKQNIVLAEMEIQQYTQQHNNPYSISSNFVTSVIRLPNGELWIGTEGGGICKVINDDHDDPKFISFSEKNGLSNNVVKSIIYDEEYNLWVATNVGLNKFDTKNFQFLNYSINDGLPFEDFNYYSAELPNGKVILSGINGFCYFDPEDLPAEEKLPNLHFANLRIFNNLILPGDTLNGRIILDKPLNLTREVKLKFNENVFSVDVHSLHFSNPKSHYIKYKLEPVNHKWIEVKSDQNRIYYSALPPGEYSLQVMASNSFYRWTKPSELRIIITPPFWKTKVAYSVYIILLLGLGYAIIFVVLRIQSLNYNLKIEQLEKNKVEEVNAAKLRFFSNISHEIKTPITLITGPIERLGRRYRNNSELNESLKVINRQAKKISRLVDQVHDFQKADANALKMNKSHFNFYSVVEQLKNDFDYLAKNEGRIFNINKPDKDIFVIADKDKLEKILNNVLSNAFKFTEKDDAITLEYKVDNDNLLLTISDTGRGIDPDDLPHIFERFYQSNKNISKYNEGSGIGLAFSKRLVEMHYGYIHATSTINEGTTISIKLPVVTNDIIEDHPDFDKEKEIIKSEERFQDSEDLSFKFNKNDITINEDVLNASIYFAEDHSDMRKLVADSLSEFFRVKSFTDGDECLRAMKTEWPDLVISDILMPKVNGLELCKSIKSDIKTSHIPVILLTAFSTTDDQIQGLKIKADAYITKPFDIAHLIARIESLLLIRKQLRERYQLDMHLKLENNSNQNNDNVFLEKLYFLMEENLDNLELNLDNFARELYLNRTHFFQKVKALTNQTPYELLKVIRLKKAAEYLSENRYSISEVVSMTGFKSRAHFSKLFKEMYGTTPGNYFFKQND